MMALMREEGWPVRIAEGFRRATRSADTPVGTFVLKNSDAHAWVEVYFPTYGWVDFDPTGGGISQLAPLPSGRPESSGSPTPRSSGGILPVPSFDIGDNEPPFQGTGPVSQSPVGPFIAITALLVALVGGIAFVVWQRGPRGPVSADGAYGSVTSLARRLGFGPRPDQTVYEFAGALGDAVPIARPELETVARAKVEVAYGGRVLGADRLAELKTAQRRLRVRLLRLLFRRDRRRPR
jgi:hypothetical protein